MRGPRRGPTPTDDLSPEIVGLQREALAQARIVLVELMTPGHRFPSSRQLHRAWRAIRLLDRAEAAEAPDAPIPSDDH